MQKLLFTLFGAILLTSCATSNYYPCSQLTYKSLRPSVIKNPDIPENASIAIYANVDREGNFTVIVSNLTDDILSLDMTKSFFVNQNKVSQSYYDPTVRTYSNTSSTSTTSGGSFNLGGLASALGVNGPVSSLMNATTVGGGSSDSYTSTMTNIEVEQPVLRIAPRGNIKLPKSFKVNFDGMPNASDIPFDDSPLKFSVCVSYSFDDGKNTDQIISEFYCNSYLREVVYNRATNDAVRRMINNKPNLMMEPWFILDSNRKDAIINFGSFLNYQ